MTAILFHENPLVLDYLTSRSFSGFQLKQQADRIALLAEDGTVLNVLRKAGFQKVEDETVELDVLPLIKRRVTIKSAIRELHFHYEPEAVDLIEALNTLHAFSDPTIKQRLTDGQAMYSDLPVLLARGTEVICGKQGGTVESCTEVSTVFATYYKVEIAIIMATSKGCVPAKMIHNVVEYANFTAIDKLSIRPIHPDEKIALTERGHTFHAFTQQPTPATYTGNLTIPTWVRDRVIGADGRVMVDPFSIAQVDADLYQDMIEKFIIDDNAVPGDVPDGDLWRTYYRVPGFSMRLKRWGWLEVDGLQPLKWRSDAFDQLVLAPEYKQIILNLVKYTGTSFTDFIDGKSGGLIFLLNGPPGSGKTLSAEAIAELLQRPLYSISVGELGTRPSELEERLRGVLDLAFQWNAVLLLDEADIYMESRDTNNIERNAMVSIFLRLLEYYSGVLFLTTNRVQTFDPAFYSRISLAITYPKLDVANRQEVWRNVLASAGIETKKLSLPALAQVDVNGRNIKTAVRIAQTLAASTQRPVAQADLINVLALMQKFGRDLEGDTPPA